MKKALVCFCSFLLVVTICYGKSEYPISIRTFNEMEQLLKDMAELTVDIGNSQANNRLFEIAVNFSDILLATKQMLLIEFSHASAAQFNKDATALISNYVAGRSILFDPAIETINIMISNNQYNAAIVSYANRMKDKIREEKLILQKVVSEIGLLN